MCNSVSEWWIIRTPVSVPLTLELGSCSSSQWLLVPRPVYREGAHGWRGADPLVDRSLDQTPEQSLQAREGLGLGWEHHEG